MRTRDIHPNLQHLLVHVTRVLAEPADKDVDDPKVFLDQLARLSEDEKLTVLRILNVASVIDGRLTVAEIGLVKEAMVASGHPVTARFVRRLKRAFVSGDAVNRRMVLEVTERPAPLTGAA